MEKKFGIVSEGPTDQIVLEHILCGFFNDESMLITKLQPSEGEPGNWDKVFKYCESEEFEKSFLFHDFVIIQIDTDFMRRGEVPEKYRINIQPQMEIQQIVTAFTAKLIQLIGNNLYPKIENKIIFAISVDEIECWFLPIYFPDRKKIYSKTSNCIKTLKPALIQNENFFINEKRYEYYEAIAKHFKKRKDIETFSRKNESFNIFITSLLEKEAQIENE